MTAYGYARVSTTDQNPQLQIDALAPLVAETFIDRGASGSTMKRPELERLLGTLKAGDTLVVWKLDRLGRSTLQVLKLIEGLTDTGVHFHSITEGFDTTTPAGRLMLTIIAAFAQMEREVLVERTRAGLEARRRKGLPMGRPKKLTLEQRDFVFGLIDGGHHTQGEIARLIGVSRKTIVRMLRDRREN